jgi:Predicted transcriptional regulators
MKTKILRDLFIGFIRIHILFHANQESVYGSALMIELARHGYVVGPGTLYPILHGLEKDDLLVSKTRVVNGKRRRCYEITGYGKELLDKARQQAKELIEEIDEENRNVNEKEY